MAQTKTPDMEYFDIEASIQTIEWYGIASAMVPPGSGFSLVDSQAVTKAKEELQESLIKFLQQNAQAILAKHMPS
jgi:hypothetical protein